MKLSITDNFLIEHQFIALKNVITDNNFHWFYGTYGSGDNPKPTSGTYGSGDKQSFPGFFYHVIYEDNAVFSPFYDSFNHILEQLNATVLFRIRINLTPSLPEPQFADFHSDILGMPEEQLKQWTTSIFYINSNNGYTEFEDDGKVIESVENRLVSFPANIRHRMVTQTDGEPRILINFNYLNGKK